MRPDEIRHAIQLAAQSRLPQAVHDATGELVETLIKSEVRQMLAPAIMQSMRGPSVMGTGFNDADSAQVAAFADLLKSDDEMVGQGRKARVQQGKLDQKVQDPRGMLYDPFSALDQMGFRERPSALTYRTLGEMARRVPPFAAYLQTRINQIASFSEPQPDDHSIGIKMVLADKRTEMNDELQAEAHRLLQTVLHLGDPNIRKKRPTFEQYLRMTTWDSLTYDAMCIEVVPDMRGVPAYWRPLDASTIRISDDLDESDEDEDTIRHVQIYDDTIVAEFPEDLLVYGVRNPRTDIRYAGYGQAELELLVVIVTAILWGIDYNAKFFRQGTVAKGILNFKGAIPDKELIAFRRQWYAMISGVENAWRTPVVNAEDLQWVNMQNSNRDMEFSMWIDWLLKVTCSVCQIAPEEIGFQFGNTGQSSSLSEGSQEQKLKFSRDKGLVPLAKFHASTLNKIVKKIDPRFRVEFAGINARTAEELIDLNTKEISSGVKTPDEVRKERGLKPHKNGLGEIPYNPIALQLYQAQQGAAPGGSGAPGVPDGAQFDRGDLNGQGAPPQDAPGMPSMAQKAAFMQQQGRPREDGMQKSAPTKGRRILDLEVDL